MGSVLDSREAKSNGRFSTEAFAMNSEPGRESDQRSLMQRCRAGYCERPQSFGGALSVKPLFGIVSGWLLVTLVAVGLAEEPPSRNRFKEGLGATEEMESFIRNFPGRGAIGDDSSPTTPAEALKLFSVAEGLRIDLVASEPDVMQPLFLHFDPRGRLWVVQYLQYPFPAGLKVVSYDQHLRAVFDKVPAPPPNHFPGADKITVFEDADHDGHFESHKDVITGLNIATAVAVGNGGIWVLNPPYLLFYPDADGDDVPDRDPEAHLSGFGLEDTHSVANSLMWGPDGAGRLALRSQRQHDDGHDQFGRDEKRPLHGPVHLAIPPALKGL
jgi:hypothetical protein